MEALGINTKLLIAQIINFSIFLLIFKKFIAKPFLNYLEQEKKEEQKREQLTKKLETAEASLRLEKEKILTQARKEATSIINEAKKSAEEIRKQLIQEATKEAQEIKEKTRIQLEEEKNKIEKEVREKIIATSGLMLSSVLGEFINPDTQDKIVEGMVKKFHESKYEN
jgi:F-type H+-transporting ATPase subunit b